MSKITKRLKFGRITSLSKSQKLNIVLIVLLVIVLTSAITSSNGSGVFGIGSSDQNDSNNANSSERNSNSKTGSSKSNSSAADNSSQSGSSKSTTPKSQTQQPTPRYYLVSTYGDDGKTYVIDPANATEAQLTLIGRDLDDNFGFENAKIGIYTDPAQAQIGANPSQVSSLQGDAATAYKNAYVAQFNVDKKSNTKQLLVYLNGKTTEVIL
jgi:hypothetical protein